MLGVSSQITTIDGQGFKRVRIRNAEPMLSLKSLCKKIFKNEIENLV